MVKLFLFAQPRKQEIAPKTERPKRRSAWKRYEDEVVEADEVDPPKRRKRSSLWETKVKSSKIEQLNVRCEPCDEVFKTRTDYERHKGLNSIGY